MYQTINDGQKAKLDAFGARWRTDVSEQNAAVRQAFLYELYHQALRTFLPEKHFAEEEQIFQDMFTLFVELFQPETQTVSDLMQQILADMYAAFSPPAEDVGFDAGMNLHINEDRAQASSTDLYSEKWFYEISCQILEFAENHSKESEHQTKLGDYRLFYTAGLIEYCQRMRSFAPKFQHERDILCSIKYPFSDYCLNDICRSIAALYQARLKKYGEVSHLCADAEKSRDIPLPIPADVGVCYLERQEQRLITEDMYRKRLQTYDAKMRKLFRKPMNQ